MINTDSNLDVSIILITWEMRDLIRKCIASIYKNTQKLKFEIIVIENNSKDGTAKMISREFPEVRLIINSINKGVAPARNQGMKIARGKYILILDADMELIENSIYKMHKFIINNPECGILGCKLISPNGRLQYSCKRFPTLLAFFSRRLESFKIFNKSRFLDHHIMKDFDHDSITTVDYVIGACQFFRSELLYQIGFYDDKIFYGPEDIDFCLRAWRFGLKVYYFPETKIIHHEQRITKKYFFSKITFNHFLGILYIYKKYKGKLGR